MWCIPSYILSLEARSSQEQVAQNWKKYLQKQMTDRRSCSWSEAIRNQICQIWQSPLCPHHGRPFQVTSLGFNRRLQQSIQASSQLPTEPPWRFTQIYIPRKLCVDQVDHKETIKTVITNLQSPVLDWKKVKREKHKTWKSLRPLPS